MKRNLTIPVLTVCLLAATAIFLSGQTAPQGRTQQAPAQPSSPQYLAQNDQATAPAPARPTRLTRRQQRSYYRETHPQRHSRISKKEVIVLGAVAGTAMGIGAIAGGGEGLAIGSIVGGWSAVAGHYIWHHLR